jgi:hypothetical protein
MIWVIAARFTAISLSFPAGNSGQALQEELWSARPNRARFAERLYVLKLLFVRLIDQILDTENLFVKNQ